MIITEYSAWFIVKFYYITAAMNTSTLIITVNTCTYGICLAAGNLITSLGFILKHLNATVNSQMLFVFLPTLVLKKKKPSRIQYNPYKPKYTKQLS